MMNENMLALGTTERRRGSFWLHFSILGVRQLPDRGLQRRALGIAG